MTTVFIAYRDGPERRAALLMPGSLDRYRLFGLDEFEARGARVHHNLERRVPDWARLANSAINRPLYAAGGYGGDFATILATLHRLNRSDVVFSTVDTVGLPITLLKRAGIVRPPIVYTSIGLPERLEQLRGERTRGLYRNSLRGCSTLIAYSAEEVRRLREWLGKDAPPVVFVPFGVDVEAFRPVATSQVDDVLSVGADPQRDFDLLVELARDRPGATFRIVTSADHIRRLGPLPSNVETEVDIPLEQVKDRLGGARVVALPVRDNSYSGATTTLLQAMAMAKPIVVSRTDAIGTGYELADGVNCRLVPPDDAPAFGNALDGLLSDAESARALGVAARETVVAQLSWRRYADRIAQIIAEASPD